LTHAGSAAAARSRACSGHVESPLCVCYQYGGEPIQVCSNGEYRARHTGTKLVPSNPTQSESEQITARFRSSMIDEKDHAKLMGFILECHLLL
jgi:hypothetical protein